MLLIAAVTLAVAFLQVNAQDTHKCPDGWLLHESLNERDECFLFSAYSERVTHDDATAICAAHNAWLADVHGPRDNSWLKSQLIDVYCDANAGCANPGERADQPKRPFYDDQFWIGAKTIGHHDTHQPGVWTWEHWNTTVEWFDWADGEPNDWQYRQQCLTFQRFQDRFGFVNYKWNDWDCDDAGLYICEMEGAEV